MVLTFEGGQGQGRKTRRPDHARVPSGSPAAGNRGGILLKKSFEFADKLARIKKPC